MYKKDSDIPQLKVDSKEIGLGQPIRDATSTWQNFLGTVTRNKVYFPIDMGSWNKETDEQKRMHEMQWNQSIQD